jgi:hypothetical protein
LSYVARYVVLRLFQTSKHKNGEHKEETKLIIAKHEIIWHVKLYCFLYQMWVG